VLHPPPPAPSARACVPPFLRSGEPVSARNGQLSRPDSTPGLGGIVFKVKGFFCRISRSFRSLNQILQIAEVLSLLRPGGSVDPSLWLKHSPYGVTICCRASRFIPALDRPCATNHVLLCK
jgi:hypothetical protein